MASANFEIVVKGTLSPPLVDAIDGFEVSRVENGLTYLVGWVPDQARLHSLIDALGNLTIELVSVNPLPAPPQSATEGVTHG
ncbi:MAG: hypothetical protein JWQ64_1140 [Subtercola sp.]|jgi:hypothetical protein|nr:hypothetical protein [Subtercola sp.]